MIIEFLETGNGTVVVNGLQPQPVAGTHVNTLATLELLATLILPRDANGDIIPGAYSGEILVQGFDPATGDTFANLKGVAAKNFAGATTVIATSDLFYNANGVLAGAALVTAPLPSGDIGFYVGTGVAANVNVSCAGIFLTI